MTKKTKDFDSANNTGCKCYKVLREKFHQKLSLREKEKERQAIN